MAPSVGFLLHSPKLISPHTSLNSPSLSPYPSPSFGCLVPGRIRKWSDLNLSTRCHGKKKFSLRSAVDEVSVIDPPPSQPDGDKSQLLASLKVKLLSAVSGLNRGLAASIDDLQKADASAKELEAVGGPVDLTVDLDKLQGRWKLIYSSAFSSRTLGGSRPGPPTGRLLPITLGQVIRAVSFSSSTSFPHNQASPAHLNLRPLNSKIKTYLRNGLIQEAQKLFDEMPQRNIVTWNTMLCGYFQNKQLNWAMQLFHQMPQRDIFSYNTLITGLMQGGDVGGAKVVFDSMAVRDVVTWNSMISGYFRNEFIEEAVTMFDETPRRDVISWNLLIGGLVNCGKLDLAEDYFRKMSGRDIVSWTIMISGLARAGRVVEARNLFEDMPIKDVQAWNAMIVGYLENGHVDPAKFLFQKMPKRDFESWKLFIGGLVNCRQISDGMKYFMEMPHKCQKTWNSILLRLIRNGQMQEAHAFLEKSPYGDVVSWTNLIVGYFEIGEFENAIKLFKMMRVRDATVWNVIIFGLGENDHGEEGVNFFVQMRESGPSLDEATFTSVLTICSSLPSLQLGRQTHALVIKMGFDHFTAVSNAMVTMYARCGNVHSALLEFSSMAHHDVISWNSIICGFAHHGNAEKALEIFEQMRQADVTPNHITFVGVLSACSHVGLVAKGKFYFDYMKNKCLLQPTTEHYTCIVDLLGRFGLIDEAMSVLDDMRADGIEVPASVWGALLGACRIHNKMELGEIAAEKVLEIEPDNSGIYLILSEMYFTCGRIEDAERIWYRMKEKRVKKQPGCSWIEINNSSHVFLSGDRSHYEFAKINYVLHLLQTEMDSSILKSNVASEELQNSHECYG